MILAAIWFWPQAGVTRVPFRVFSDPAIYAEEQKRLFRGPIWNFLCLEIEIPIRATGVSPRSVKRRSSSRGTNTARSTPWSIAARTRARWCACRNAATRKR